jgi:hypothetical protein
MADVHIAYADADRTLAKTIAGSVEQQGYSVDWSGLRSEIDDAGSGSQPPPLPSGAQCVIALWSQHARVSQHVMRDLQAARQDRALIVVLVDDTPLPPGFEGCRTIDVRGAQGEAMQRQIGVLVAAIRQAGFPTPAAAKDAEAKISAAIGSAAARKFSARTRVEGVGSAIPERNETRERLLGELRRSGSLGGKPYGPAPAAPRPAPRVANAAVTVDAATELSKARLELATGASDKLTPESIRFNSNEDTTGVGAADAEPMAPPPPPTVTKHGYSPSAPASPHDAASPRRAGSGRFNALGFVGVFAVAAAITATYLARPGLFSTLSSQLLAALGFKLNAFTWFGLLRKPEAQTDAVDCSMFSPRAARPGATVMIQVFFHREEQAERAQFLANLMDTATELKGVQSLSVAVARGARIDVSLSDPSLTIAEPVQSIVWSGKPAFCQFLVTLPDGCAGRTFHPVVRISVTGGLVGRIMFGLAAAANTTTQESVPAGEQARRYEHAFLSYATADRKEVLKRAQVLRAAGVSFFQDVLSLDPGQRWQQEIYKNIDRCDLFLLFWSSSARDSEWVVKEALYALDRQNQGSDLDIVPVILEGPPVVLPPDGLKAIHFDDRIRHLIANS